MKRVQMRWFFLTGLAGVCFFIWGSDSITLQGERTVYTVECVDGIWSGSRCTGKFVATSRYRYRALKAHNEVLFWVVGSPEPSLKFSRCAIQDGRNWKCPAENADAPKSVTLAMMQGNPVRDAAWPTRPLHRVSKWTWMLLNSGLRFTQVEDGD